MIERGVRLKDHNHAAFERGAGRFKEIAWYVCKCCFFLTVIPFPSRFKAAILRAFGAKVGTGMIIRPRVNIQMPWKLTIGNDCWIGEEAFILNFDFVVIGDDVCISQRSFLCAANHNYRDPLFTFRASQIYVGSEAWLGAGSFIMPNVTIAPGTMVSAAAVVMSNTDTNGVYAGNPAKWVRNRWQHAEKR